MTAAAVRATLGRRFERFRTPLARIGLPAWFVAIDLLWIAKPDVLGIDARHYQRAADAWLAGGNPWAVTEGGVPYLAGPHTLLFYVPTSILPVGLSTAAWLVIGAVAAVWAVRLCRLPAWWVLFPPLAHAIWNANPQTLMLGLLIQGSVVAGVIAVGLKLYAGVLLLWRPRTAVVAGLALVALLPLFPWPLYLSANAEVSQHLTSAWNGSAWRIPILLVPTAVALWLLRHRGAEWLAIPALWPATQFYYVSTALPFVARRPLAAAAIALPVPLLVPILAMVFAVRHVIERRQRTSSSHPPDPRPASSSAQPVR